jgi:hypothetical protein
MFKNNMRGWCGLDVSGSKQVQLRYLLGKITVPELAKKFPARSVRRMFITVKGRG